MVIRKRKSRGQKGTQKVAFEKEQRLEGREGALAIFSGRMPRSKEKKGQKP